MLGFSRNKKFKIYNYTDGRYIPNQIEISRCLQLKELDIRSVTGKIK